MNNILQVFGTPRNISIPSSSFSDGKGSYSLQVPMKKDDTMLLTMSDATGFNTGGTTRVLTVGASKGGQCNTTDPGQFIAHWIFDRLLTLKQVSILLFS